MQRFVNVHLCWSNVGRTLTDVQTDDLATLVVGRLRTRPHVMSKLLSIMSYMGTLLYNVEQSIVRLVAQPSSNLAANVYSDLELNFHFTLGSTFAERSGNIEPNVHADVRPTFRQPSGNVEPNVHADVRPTFRQGSGNVQPNVHADVRETFGQSSGNVEPNVHADVRPTFRQRSRNVEPNVHADVRPTFTQR